MTSISSSPYFAGQSSFSASVAKEANKRAKRLEKNEQRRIIPDTQIIPEPLYVNHNLRDRLGKSYSRLLDKLHNPIRQENIFHQRKPSLNHIPFFYSAMDTEIPDKNALQQLSEIERARISTRLIAKRFIDTDTSFNFDAPAKGNPILHHQPKYAREIRGEAATDTINRYKGQYIHSLYRSVMDSISERREPLVIHMIRPGRNLKAKDATVNYLSLVAQREVTESLNHLAKRDGMSSKVHFSDLKQLPVISRTARSNASPLGRLVQQGFYDTSEISKGDHVIIVDDHSQAGATILSMAAAMHNKGAKVLAAITPTTHPFCTQLSMTPPVKELLKKTLQAWDPEKKFARNLEALGMPLSTLTNHEALIIIAYATDPKNLSARKNFENLEKLLLGNGTVPEGESDSLKPILNRSPLPVKYILAEMGQEMIKNRFVTKAQPIQNVHVLDWDDFLRDEKGLNYRLMHNAVAVAAKRYGKDYPFLEKLQKALDGKRGRYTNANMPLLSMPPQQFADTTIRNIKFFKRDAIRDLLSHLDGLEPGLQKKFETLSVEGKGPRTLRQNQKAIDNILWHEFRRQYQAALQSKTHAFSAGAELPYPVVRPSWMAGAKNLLNKIRRPENFVSLISNRWHSDLVKELNQMNLMHYFDDVQGTPAELSYVDGKATLSDPKFKKPDSYRLEELIRQNPSVVRAKKWHFWGDTPKDITQALPLLNKVDLTRQKLSGTLVNPNPQVLETARVFIKSQSPQSFKIRTKSSLLDNKSMSIQLGEPRAKIKSRL